MQNNQQDNQPRVPTIVDLNNKINEIINNKQYNNIDNKLNVHIKKQENEFYNLKESIKCLDKLIADNNKNQQQQFIYQIVLATSIISSTIVYFISRI